ncbi:MAG: glycosyltransferase family 4 protein [Cyanobacteria bacterium J06554_6]
MVSSTQLEALYGRLDEEKTAQEKILLVANTGWYLYNFRLPLAQALRQRGVEVVLVSPWDPYVDRLKAEGFWWIELDLIRHSTNPFLELYSVLRFLLIYWVQKPDLVHHFTIKCVLYGTFAAKLTGVGRVVNAITGLGYVFSSQGLKARLLRPLIKFLYFFVLRARRGRVIFQNADDQALLVNSRLVSPSKAILVPSSGVDLTRFQPRLSKPGGQPTTVLMAARVVGNKGVYEYVAAAQSLRSQAYPVTFNLAGGLYASNPTAISEAEVRDWEARSLIHWLGHIDDIEAAIAEADIVVLPSHGGEGVPRILLEAAAMAKPLIATDVPGCRDVIVPGRNGFLVPVGEVKPLTDAIQLLLDDPELRQRFGQVGREQVATEFDVNGVVKKTLEVYEQMGVGGLPSQLTSVVCDPAAKPATL